MLTGGGGVRGGDKCHTFGGISSKCGWPDSLQPGGNPINANLAPSVGKASVPGLNQP